MTDVSKIVEVIRTINQHCWDMDKKYEEMCAIRSAEKQSIDRKSEELISEMLAKYDAFKATHFVSIKKQVEALTEFLSLDYKREFINSTAKNNDYDTLSYEECETRLHSLIKKLNEYVMQLNSLNFDELVPPVKLDISGEAFVTYSGNGANKKEYDYVSTARKSMFDPQPIRGLVRELFPYCREIELCVDALMRLYDQRFNIDGFKAFVKSSGASWIAEKEAKLQTEFNNQYEALFVDEKAKAVPRSFFLDLIREGEAYEVDVKAGTDTYNEAITIGNAEYLVDTNHDHLEYIKNSPTLNKYLVRGRLPAPVILDLKKCGNVFLNVSEENYAEDTIAFINQLIIQFLLSFPANRINFCLVDIDNKVGFSHFKLLTKINNNILFNGIIRDDRQLENTIKDMEQLVFKIEDDFLSTNNVPDIFEYNKSFEANPQSIHLFVFVNYPTGMREDIAKRVMTILHNGNRSGVFSIIINNNACPLSPGYKPEEYAHFVENAEKLSTVINKSGSIFNLKTGNPNCFVPNNTVKKEMLPDIVEMLRKNAESNRQKVISLEQMYNNADALAASPDGTPPSARVLDIPIGARGAEVQTLCLKTSGDGSAHGVIIGGTGSGKSNLLHTIIMSACYKYSPEELNVYLLDLKEGVEFKYYEEHRLPHVKLLGVDLKEDLNSVLAILKNLRQEISRRGELFKRYGIAQIDKYEDVSGKKLPRILVIIDEIQEMFELDEKIGQEAIMHLSELFKQGRAFGINILWSSQNIPNAPGLKDKVLSQIGNRISLRLNEPDNALDIKIDPKVVRNLNRPEKGLGVINDMRYGNDSIEFRVAYAEEGEGRDRYSRAIVDKWRTVTDSMVQEPLFVVGGDEDVSPISGDTLYTVIPTAESIVSKAFENYTIQLGQDYVTGKPFGVDIAIRQNKMNMLISGGDIEVLRDIMGYTMLSLILNQRTNLDWYCDRSKIYYANGEMLNPKNSEDLFNIVRSDFGDMIENISSSDRIADCIRDTYKLYKERIHDPDNAVEAKRYAPCFVVIHSLQRYSELFTSNPSLKLKEVDDKTVEKTSVDLENHTVKSYSQASSGFNLAVAQFNSSNTRLNTPASVPVVKEASRSEMPDMVFFSDAFKELLKNGGEVGIHFIISIDNPNGINALKTSITEAIDFKVFTKGVDVNSIASLLGDARVADSLKNPKVAMLTYQGEKMKFRIYRYEQSQDFAWYKALCDKYKALGGDRH